VLRTVYPDGMRPGTPLWAVCLVWLVAVHCGEAFEALGAPQALGYMLAGVALRSLPGAPGLPSPLDGRSRAWSRDIRAGAMALVLLRAGLGLNLGTVRLRLGPFMALTALPCSAEALAGALVARALFGMPFLLAWALGWLNAAVGPAVVSASCAAVKERGYAPRAPNFIMQCMCFDDALCIFGFSCALHAFLSDADGRAAPLRETWGYLTGPLSLALGLAGGVLGAAVMACTAVWSTPVRRSAMLLLLCSTLSYITASLYKQTGAGAIAILTLGLGTRHAWRAAWPAPLLCDEHRAEGRRAADAMLLDAQRHLTAVWRAAMFPLLFGLLGASFDIRTRSDGVNVSLPRAAGYALAAIALRLFCAWALRCAAACTPAHARAPRAPRSLRCGDAPDGPLHAPRAAVHRARVVHQSHHAGGVRHAASPPVRAVDRGARRRRAAARLHHGAAAAVGGGHPHGVRVHHLHRRAGRHHLHANRRLFLAGARAEAPPPQRPRAAGGVRARARLGRSRGGGRRSGG